MELGEVLLEAGDFTEATSDLEAAIAAAEAIGDERLRARARLGRLGISLYAEELESGVIGRALEEATQAAELFETAGDEAGLARAWRLAGSLHATAGQYEAGGRGGGEGRGARDAGRRQPLASRAAAGYATIARAGSMTAAEVVDRCGPLLDQVSGDRKAEAVILARDRGGGGDAGPVRPRARPPHPGQDDPGRARPKRRGGVDVDRGLTDRDARGRRGPRRGVAGGRRRRARADRRALLPVDRRGPLAHAIEAQDRLEDADAAVDLAIELTDEDDIESQILWRTARAKVRARRGDGDEARRLADEALALAADTDDIDVQGDVHADYGAVLVRLGRTDEAAIQFIVARELYARKGNAAFETAMTTALEGAGQAA